MNKQEIATFIEEMSSIGDEWTPQQVEEVYADVTLEDALSDRKASVGTLFDMIGKVLNRED